MVVDIRCFGAQKADTRQIIVEVFFSFSYKIFFKSMLDSKTCLMMLKTLHHKWKLYTFFQMKKYNGRYVLKT